jgi:hypothetical protein
METYGYWLRARIPFRHTLHIPIFLTITFQRKNLFQLFRMREVIHGRGIGQVDYLTTFVRAWVFTLDGMFKSSLHWM